MIDRRDFLVTSALLGGGLALGVGSARATPWAADAATANEFNPWIAIAPDDVVTITVSEPEIGNGAMTQMAMTIVEELNCAWGKVRVVNASTHRNYVEKGVYALGFQPFFGGHSTQEPRLGHGLQMGASARERLKAAAGARLQVPVDQIEASESLLIHKASGRKLRYGDVAAEAAMLDFEAEPKPKPREQWRLLGKASPPKLHIPQIVTGKAIYGADVRLPGMVYAALLQSPVHGGTLKSHKPEAVLKMPGVRAVVVVDPVNSRKSPAPPKSTFGFADSRAQQGVAVIADHYWQARTALEALPVEWDAGQGGAVASEAEIYAAAEAKIGKDARTLKKLGDPAVVPTGKRVIEATYGTPYCENAAMEPLVCTALVTADSAEVWASTQDTQQAYWVTIDETGLAPGQVRLHATLVGGGFGRRGQGDDVRMAVAVARQFPGKPVQTIWTREETFRQGRYRTPIVTKFKAVLDDTTDLPQHFKGDCAYVGTSPTFQLPLGFSDMPWFSTGVIPNVLLTSVSYPVHILNGAWRGPCYNSHAFFVDGFIDECAVVAGIDPLDYRLKLLEGWETSWTNCLKLVAEKSGWGGKLPKGEGRGIAISCWPIANNKAFGTVVATAVRVKVSKAGELRVEQVDVAFDCGSIVNRDAVRAQIEGATYYGMNAAINEELTVKDGAIVEGNFDEYVMMRMADTPPVNVHFGALSGHKRMQIIGEAATGPIQPAIGNAIFAATGKRLRRTPFRKQDLSWS